MVCLVRLQKKRLLSAAWLLILVLMIAVFFRSTESTYLSDKSLPLSRTVMIYKNWHGRSYQTKRLDELVSISKWVNTMSQISISFKLQSWFDNIKLVFIINCQRKWLISAKLFVNYFLRSWYFPFCKKAVR